MIWNIQSEIKAPPARHYYFLATSQVGSITLKFETSWEQFAYMISICQSGEGATGDDTLLSIIVDGDEHPEKIIHQILAITKEDPLKGIKAIDDFQEDVCVSASEISDHFSI